jgi:hypothetical protein
MTYGVCEGSKSFGREAASSWATRDSLFLKRPEQNRYRSRGLQTRSSCSKASQGTRAERSRSNQSREDIFGISRDRTAKSWSAGFVQFGGLFFALDLHFRVPLGSVTLERRIAAPSAKGACGINTATMEDISYAPNSKLPAFWLSNK